MPNAFVNIEDQEVSISRPLNFAVAKDVLAQMGYPADAFVEYPGESQMQANQGSTLDDEGHTPSPKNFFGTDSRAFLTVDETPVIERVYEGNGLHMRYEPFFKDQILNAYVRTVYTPYKNRLNFNLRFTDETLALKWHSDIQARSRMTRTVLIHKPTYHYPFPEPSLFAMWNIYKTKEEVEATTETFPQWFGRCTDPRVTSIANRSGDQVRLVVAEEAVNVQGWFDFTVVGDRPRYNKDKGEYSVEFGYEFVYDRPIMVAMTYPLVVMNKPLPASVIELAGSYDLSRENVGPSIVGDAYNHFTGTFSPLDDRHYAGRYPEYDTWHPQLQNNWTCTLLTILVTITPDDRRNIINLGDLPKYKFTDETISFLKKDRAFVVKTRRSIFEISLWENDHCMADGVLSLDEDLNLVATRDLSLVPVYHLRIAVLKDFSLLSEEDGDRYQKDACEVYQYLAWLYPHLDALGLIPKPSRRCTWTEDQWDNITDICRPPEGPGTGINPDDDRHPKTTVTFGIIALRGE